MSYLEEIINPRNCEGDVECNYLVKHFRPVQTRKTDISIFTALLNTQDEFEEVPFQ